MSRSLANGVAGRHHARVIDVVRQGARWGAVVAALGLLWSPAAVVEAGEGDESVDAETEVVQLKVELKLESGRVVRLPGEFTLDWGVGTEVEIEADGSTHQISITLARKGGAKVSITLGYARNGEPIIAPYTFDTKVNKREVVRVEGGLAIALTVKPKNTKGQPDGEEEEPPPPEVEPPSEKIDIDEDDDDPLGGVE